MHGDALTGGEGKNPVGSRWMSVVYRCDILAVTSGEMKKLGCFDRWREQKELEYPSQ